MEQKLIHLAAQRLTNKLNLYTGRSGLELQKIALGMEILLINVSKIIVIYFLAAIFGVIAQTATIHLAFFALKRYSFGLHALNSTVCTIVSCLMLVVIPWALQGVGIGNIVVCATFASVILCLYLYAPADTKAKPLVGEKNRMRLKVKSVVCGVGLMIIAVLVPNYEMKLLIVLGAAYQCIAILPLTYKLLKRSGKNYERHECK